MACFNIKMTPKSKIKFWKKSGIFVKLGLTLERFLRQNEF